MIFYATSSNKIRLIKDIKQLQDKGVQNGVGSLGGVVFQGWRVSLKIIQLWLTFYNTYMKIPLLLLLVCLSIGNVQAQVNSQLKELPEALDLIDLTEILRQLNITISQLLEQDKALNSNNAQSTTNTNKIDVTPVSTPKAPEVSPTNIKSVESQVRQTATVRVQTKAAQQVVQKVKEQIKVTPRSNNQVVTSNNSATRNVVAQTETRNNASQNRQMNQTKDIPAAIVRPAEPIPVAVPAVVPRTQIITPPTRTPTTTVINTPARSNPMPAATVSNASQDKSSKTDDRITNVDTYLANGPGPLDKSLPAVVGSKDVVVQFVYKPPTASNTETIAQTQPARQEPSTNIFTAPPQTRTPSRAVQQPKAIPQVKVVPQPQPRTIAIEPKPIVIEPTIKEVQTVSIAPNTLVVVPSIIEQDKVNINRVILAPVVSRPEVSSSLRSQQVKIVQVRPSVPLQKNREKKVEQQGILSYQYVQSNPDAIYRQMPSYLDLQRYFIMTHNDPYLHKLQGYLLKNYGHYLRDGKLFAGFRRYITGGDRCIDYQLYYETIFGTFSTIITYYINSEDLQLKTLSIINYNIMDIDFVNCLVKNEKARNCQICKAGFRNFMGRCKAIDPFCSKYTTDECSECIKGRRILYGECL